MTDSELVALLPMLPHHPSSEASAPKRTISTYCNLSKKKKLEAIRNKQRQQHGCEWRNHLRDEEGGQEACSEDDATPRSTLACQCRPGGDRFKLRQERLTKRREMQDQPFYRQQQDEKRG